MELPKKKQRSIIRIFATAGVLIPLTLTVCTWIEFWIDIKRIPLTLLYGHYLWPSRILLMAIHHDHFSISTVIILSVSVGANVLLYTMIGVLVKGITVAWRRVFKAA
jgi:hypothetical protein